MRTPRRLSFLVLVGVQCQCRLGGRGWSVRSGDGGGGALYMLVIGL